MRCRACDIGSVLSDADPLKADVLALFRAAHAGHRLEIDFRRSAPISR